MSLTPLDKNAIKQSFERAASGYDQHAVLEREVESRLLERLAFVRREPGLVLDIGCGVGTASIALARRFGKAKILALDFSLAMLGQVHRDDVKPPWVLCADMHSLPLAARSVDLVFSNLALQWSNDLSGVFQEFRRVMKPEAMLVFTCYGPDTLHELKQAWRVVDDRQHVNDFPDMHDIGDELMSGGFREPVMDAERMTVDYPDLMTMMRELKGSGANNVATHRWRGLTGKLRLQAMQQAYRKFCQNGRFPVSYEVVYGATFAPAEGQPVRTPDGDIASFSIDALRSR